MRSGKPQWHVTLSSSYAVKPITPKHNQLGTTEGRYKIKDRNAHEQQQHPMLIIEPPVWRSRRDGYNYDFAQYLFIGWIRP